MIVPAPESTTWISLSEAGEVLKHFLGSIGLQHNLSGLNGVPFRDVHQEVDMVECKTKVSEFKTESFQVVERLDTDVDVDLFSKAVISVVGDEHHRHPVIAGVTRNLFRATAIYNIHEFFSPVASLKGQVNTCHTRQKDNSLSGEKRDATFHLRVLPDQK